MGTTFKTTINRLKSQDILWQLIIVNVLVFLIIATTRVIAVLFDLTIPNFNYYIAVPSNLKLFVVHLWTVFTYMFVHYEVLHIVFNMLMLFWFGQIFRMYFTSKNMVGVYILGGLAGALLYILAFNTIPYFIRGGDSFMIGASASVTAIIFAAAFYNKNMEVNLFLLGPVKIIYIALFIFIIDFIALGSGSNEGGHIAHIGGALFGYIYAIQFSKGRDLTKWFNSLIDKLANLFKKKSKLRITHQRTESDYDYNRRKYEDATDIDSILDKIKQSGYNSLSDKEKKRLFDESNK